MSYDLLFNQPGLTRDQFTAYFSQKPRYELNENQAWYTNEDTGVYFVFEYNSGDPDEPDREASRASFNLNFYRPHFFALEAEPEVRAFVEHSCWKVEDPQTGGMGEADYRTDDFLSGWNAGNAASYQLAFRTEHAPATVHDRPTEELELIWRWNLEREVRHRCLGENVFAPKVAFFNHEGTLRSMVVWTDGIPTLFPPVDSVIGVRIDCAPRRWFRRKHDTCMIAFKELKPLLDSFSTHKSSLDALVPDYTSPPGEITRFVKSMTPVTGQLEGVSMDQVLNRELLARYRQD